MPDEFVFLAHEDGHLAELLSTLQHGDFAQILNRLSPSAKDELRAIIGSLMGESQMDKDQE